jgi:tetratricopeptide (TPR) repeat protein
MFAEAHFNLGLVRLQQKKFDDATTSFQEALKLKPGLRGANFFLGVTRYRKSDYEGAIFALKSETHSYPTNAQAYMWLGVAQLAAGQPEAASANLDKAAQLKPGDVDILYHRGRAHMLVSRQSYEQMFKADPKSWRVHEVLAEAFFEADRFDEATNECRQAIELAPAELGLHEKLGDIYQKQNNLAAAEGEFQKELQNDPESISAMYKLGLVNLEESKPEATVGLMTEVLRLAPKSANAAFELGRAQAQMGKPKEALRSFAVAVKEADPSDTELLQQSYYHMAQLYRIEHRAEESQAALDSFVRLKQETDARQAQTLEDKLKRSRGMKADN